MERRFVATIGSNMMFKWSKKITPSQVETLIRAEKDIQKAVLIFDSATAEYLNGFRHDQNTFRLMISRLASANQFVLAEEFLTKMKENGDVTEDTFLSICRGYGRVHRPLDAMRVFDKMKELCCEPTPKSYVTVFSILVEENQLKLALRFYRSMRESGIPPSIVSLNVLIKALCKNSGTIDAAIKIFREMPNRGCAPDAYTYGTLINGFCRLGRIVEAKDLFKEMEAKGCLPTVITYSSMIHGLCQANKLDEATELLEEMVTKDIEPNVFTYSSLMAGFCKGGRSSQAIELFDMMLSKHHKPNMVTYSTLIDGLCRDGKLQESSEILDRMKLQGLKPDAGLYGKIISGFCEVCKFEEAANFLDEMVLSGITPNRVTWSRHVKLHNMVVQGLCTKRNSNRAFHLYLSMRTRGISIDSKTYVSLATWFSKKGDIQKASRVINEMVLDGLVPDEETWSIMVEGFWDQDEVREAAKLLQVNLTTGSSEHQ